MNNIGVLYKFELKKILCRKITAIVLIIVSLVMVAMNIGEYVAGSKLVNKSEKVLAGRPVDDTLLDEMRAAVIPKTVTMDDGSQMIIGIGFNNAAYQPLFEYLVTIGGNFDKAYNMTEAELQKRFTGVIEEPMHEQYLTEKEIAFWKAEQQDYSWPLTYEKIQNGWGDSVTIIYVVSILSLITIAATLSGVFSDEIQLHTDALIFSSKNGRRKLMTAKMLAGITAGMLEVILILGICVAVEFGVSGFAGGETSVQFFAGPTLMDMSISKAFRIFVGTMLIIGLLMSVLVMCLSQTFKNSIAVIAVMMGLWLLSMITLPYSWRVLSQMFSYLPVTFLGNWTFSDYRMVNLFGHMFSIFQVAPVVYLAASVILYLLTRSNYNKYQVVK